MITHCLNCEAEIENPHPNKKYCSAKCKREAFEFRRSQRLTENTGVANVQTDVNPYARKTNNNIDTLEHLLKEKDSTRNIYVENERLHMKLDFLTRDFHDMKRENEYLRNDLKNALNSINQLKLDMKEVEEKNNFSNRMMGILEETAPVLIQGIMTKKSTPNPNISNNKK